MISAVATELDNFNNITFSVTSSEYRITLICEFYRKTQIYNQFTLYEDDMEMLIITFFIFSLLVLVTRPEFSSFFLKKKRKNVRKRKNMTAPYGVVVGHIV